MEDIIMLDIKDGAVVRISKDEDVDFLKDKLREQDVAEIWASNHHTPEEALKISLNDSIVCLTLEDKGQPVAMFGVSPQSAFQNEAIVWMLASPALYNMRTKFLRNCKAVINLFYQYYPYLYNFVDARNKKTIRWLKYLGATVSEPENYGYENLPFHYFCFEGRK
jgi:hypothetical protein